MNAEVQDSTKKFIQFHDLTNTVRNVDTTKYGMRAK